MNIKQAIELIELSIDADVPALLIGHSGTGKSDVVNQIGKRLGVKVVTKMLSQVEIGDLGGIPFRDTKDNKMYHAKPHWIPDNEPIILFLDELNQAQRDVESAAFDLVLNREVNGHKLPKGSKVIAAINPNTSEYTTTNQISSALIKRFVVIPFEPTVTEFLSWAKDSKRVHPALMGFVKDQPDALGLKDLDIQMTIESCSRTMTMASDLINAAVKKDPTFLETSGNTLTNILKGTVGTSNAAKFLAWQKSQDKPMTFKQIIKEFPEIREKWLKNLEELRGDLVSVTVKNFNEGIQQYIQDNKMSLKYTTHVSDVDATDKSKADLALKELKDNVKNNLNLEEVDNMISFLGTLPPDLFYGSVKTYLEYLPVQKGFTSQEATAALNFHHTLLSYMFNNNCNDKNSLWDRLSKNSDDIKDFLKGIEEDKKKSK